MIFCFMTNNGVAILGTLLPVTKEDLKRYVKMYPIHWVVA